MYMGQKVCSRVHGILLIVAATCLVSSLTDTFAKLSRTQLQQQREQQGLYFELPVDEANKFIQISSEDKTLMTRIKNAAAGRD
mmetsp:Transcript_7782/g.17963  ORF Transcript_7782/g.17963 Transcript_7782/m.17963 type:complete len:83 (+) Transcript_7782:132-380(+)